MLGYPGGDGALEDHPTFLAEEWILNQIDAGTPSTWHVMSGAPDRVIGPRLPVGDPFGTGDECGRPIEPGEGIQPPGGMCRWFELRDTTGEMRREFGQLGLYDDGWLTVSEESLHFAERLDAAGVEHELTIFEDATHNILSSSGDAEAAYVERIAKG